MKLFFSASIRGGRQLITTYEYIVGFLRSQDHTVLSEHVAMQNLDKAEATMTEQKIFQKDINWIEESDRMIAEVTVPSIGVGYEICHAVFNGKPVLCVYKEDTKTSAMVLGNKDVTTKSYLNLKELENILKEFLA
ncbi:MAG: nucleoside 2-deoxyribosyltransferase [Candidatus Methanoperedens sp.]|nr:nucleoside 2-deoxyribosyltransferase [Candidatus Methanoperedens sp.]MCE8426863.1 nucleoside 2-deoxyribosyltransferase [Candidatus Methanoperedens sp.]